VAAGGVVAEVVVAAAEVVAAAVEGEASGFQLF
jgi:hypothetical protein